MTIDTGLEARGGAGRSPSSWRGRPPRASMQDRSAIPSNARSRWSACLLRGEPVGCRRPGSEMSLWPSSTEWRDRALAGAASALKERRARRSRGSKSPDCNPRWARYHHGQRIAVRQRSPAIEAKSPLARRVRRGRDDEPDVSPSTSRSYGLARVSHRVERFARRRLSLSQGSAIACDRPSSPRSGRPLSGC